MKLDTTTSGKQGAWTEVSILAKGQVGKVSILLLLIYCYSYNSLTLVNTLLFELDMLERNSYWLMDLNM